MKYFSFLIIISTVLMLGCKDDSPGSMFDPNFTGAPVPVITEVDPLSGSLAAIGIVYIMGENFSSVPHENIVYFGKKDGKILEASEIKLTVQAPDEIGDSLRLRVSVAGAIDFSNTVMYTLKPAVEIHPDINEIISLGRTRQMRMAMYLYPFHAVPNPRVY
jgi:hypothetical protein